MKTLKQSVGNDVSKNDFKVCLGIDSELKTLISSSEMLSSKVHEITKVKGLSLLTVATVIAETALSSKYLFATSCPQPVMTFAHHQS